MGELIFVGLGLGEGGMTLAGLGEMRDSEFIFLEEYTSPPSPTLVKDLEATTGKKVALLKRERVEDGTEILDKAARSKVVLAVQGDPMVATTHTDLRVRAASRGISTRIVHAASVPVAAASESGLHYYKFGGAITLTLESASHYQDVYRRVHHNLLEGQHTLLLLEYDVEKRVGAEPPFAFAKLLDAERNFKRGVIAEGTFAIVLERVGMRDQQITGGPVWRLRRREFGPAPHCIIIPGRLHFTEEEALSAILRLEKKEVTDNSAEIRRTAQVLVPRYVEKAKRAVGQAREKLKGKHDDLLENAELYLRDSEGFLANGEDELAMLSVGYAEGLVDALSFTGEVKLTW